MNDLSKWIKGAEFLGALPKEARCKEFGWAVLKRWPNPENKVGYQHLIARANPNCLSELQWADEIYGYCLRVDDFAELDSSKFLENCGMVIVEKVRNNICSVDFILDGKFDAGLFGECKTAFPRELNYFLAIVEIAKKAWIEKLPEWQEIWFKGFGVKK